MWGWILIGFLGTVVIIWVIWKFVGNKEDYSDREGFFGKIKGKVDACCGGIKDGIKGLMRR